MPSGDEMRVGTLRGLLARCEGLSGPDREMDLLLARVTGHRFVRPDGSVRYVDNGQKHGDFLLSHQYPRAREEIAKDMGLPRFTASLDDAVALVERVLPGWAWSCGTCVVSNDAWVKPDVEGPDKQLCDLFDNGFFGDAKGGSVPLSLIVAMLLGLIAKVEHEQAHGATEAAQSKRGDQEREVSDQETSTTGRPNWSHPIQGDAEQRRDADGALAKSPRPIRDEPGLIARHEAPAGEVE